LHWVVDSINRSPNTKFIYTDEDKLNDLGERYDPYFKPEFNYELMLAQNMVCHFTCINRSLFEELGGLRSEYDGSQDYDLTLRVIEVIPPSEIVHIPRVLYHWRACEGSTAITTDNKGYALAAARQAIADHLERTGLAGTVTDTIVPFYNRVVFDLPSPAPSVSIIIPTRDKLELIKVCVESILEKTQYTHFNICIVDNGSQDPRVIDFYQSLPKDRVQIINADIPFNFSKLVNLGVQASSSEVVVLLNNDIEVLDAGWLSELVSHTVRPGVGAVGAKLLYPNGRSQHNGVILGLGTLPNRSHGVAGHSHKWFPDEQPGYISRAQLHQAFSAVTGACLAVKRTTWGALGGFDENLVVAFNDVDFCLRVQKSGLRNVWTPHAKLVHHESASRGYEDTPEKQARYLVEAAYMVKNWEAELMNDHFYSPNLTLKLEDFSLAWPPRVS
jgi:GT2 family glycosyltransferase